jgi:hypothetical protein
MLTARPLATDLAALRSQLEGTIVLPGEPAWDQARQAWNLAVDQRPALVALPRSSRDVQLLVEHARETGLRVAMQGTGHNAGPLGGDALENTMLVRTSEMRGVHIDARPAWPASRPAPCGRRSPGRRPRPGWRRSPAPPPTSAWSATRSAAA